MTQGPPRRSWVICTSVLLAITVTACAGNDDGPDAAEEPTQAQATGTATTEPAPTAPPTPEATPTPFPEPPEPEPLGFQEVNLARCLDITCSQIHTAELDRQEKVPPMELPAGVRQVHVDDIMVRADGRPLILARWDTPHVLDSGPGTEMVLYSCDDAACSSVSTQTVMAGANGWSGTLLPDGTLAISYQSGRSALCLEECADPESNDLSSLELLLCPDPDDCSSVTGRIVVLDREGMTGLFGGWLLVGPAGEPIVVYTREVGPGVVEVRVANCSDPTCSAVNLTTVLGPELGDLMTATIQPDGSPILIRRREFESRSEAVVVACEDPACQNTVVSTTLVVTPGDPESFGPAGLAVAEDGTIFIPGGGSLFDGSEFDGYWWSVLSCPDRSCESPQQSPTLFEQRDIIGAGAGPVGVTPDGRVWFHYEVGAPEAEPAYLAYTVCDDVECSSATTRRVEDPSLFVDEWDPGTPSGLMMFALYTDVP